MPTPYAFDPTGTLLANRITGEQHILTGVADRNFHFIVPTYAPFFAESCTISYRDIDNNIRFLVEGIDYLLGFQFIAASRSCAKPIYGGISYLNLELAGVVTLVYQTVGGDWTIDPVQINEILSDTLRNPRVTSWETVANVPTLFPVVDHEWNLQDLVGMSDVKDSIDAVTTAIANAPAPAPLEYPGLVATKHTVGLGNVQNFSIATDAEAQAGTSITKYMTPRAVRVAIQFLGDLLDNVQASLLALAAKTGATLVGTATNQTLDQAILRVKTIAELRTLDIPSTDAAVVHSVVVLGRDAVGDTATGTYYWSTTSAEVDNGYTVVKPDSDPALGRWIHEDKDAYSIYGFTTTLNQDSFVLGKSPLPGTHVKIVVNKFVELISTINYFVNDKTITFTEAFPADQRVDIIIQTKPVKSNDPGNSIYQKFTATGPGDVYLLTRRPIDPDAYCVRLNDALVLFHGVDFTVVDNQFTISYPVLAGDVVEFMYHYHPTGLSPFVLREVVGW